MRDERFRDVELKWESDAPPTVTARSFPITYAHACMRFAPRGIHLAGHDVAPGSLVIKLAESGARSRTESRMSFAIFNSEMRSF